MPLHAGLTSRAFSHHLNIKEAKGCHIKHHSKRKAKHSGHRLQFVEFLPTRFMLERLYKEFGLGPIIKSKQLSSMQQDKWAIYENAHEAIINPRQFVLVQRTSWAWYPDLPTRNGLFPWQGFSVAVIVAALWCVKRRPPATSVSATIPVVTTRIPENVPRTVSHKSNWRMPSFGFYKSISHARRCGWLPSDNP